MSGSVATLVIRIVYHIFAKCICRSQIELTLPSVFFVGRYSREYIEIQPYFFMRRFGFIYVDRLIIYIYLVCLSGIGYVEW